MMINDSTLQWLAGSMATAMVTLLAATWRAGRVHREAEHRLQQLDTLLREHQELRDFLFGVPTATPPKPGFTTRVQQAEEAAAYAARVCRLVFRAFKVPSGADDAEVLRTLREAINGGGVEDTGLHPVVQLPTRIPTGQHAVPQHQLHHHQHQPHSHHSHHPPLRRTPLPREDDEEG